MKKLFLIATLCVLLIFSAGVVADEEYWIEVDPLENVTVGVPVTLSGTTNLEPRTLLKINLMPLGSNYPKTIIVPVLQGQNGVNIWSGSVDMDYYFPGVCRITITGQSGNSSVSVDREIVVPDPWITIDPIPFVTEGMNVTFSGTTNLAPGLRILVEVMNSDATLCGMNNIFGRSLTTNVLEGNDGTQTWNATIDTTGFPSKEFTIKLNGIEVDVTKTEHFMVYPAGSTTLVPTKEITKKPTADPNVITWKGKEIDLNKYSSAETTPTQAPGFTFIMVLLGGTAAVMLRRK
ncbi:hypothetical protein [Methanorbis furvi]|uniref:DUF3821 domain-containing protein n=1 Tax=Methanorbis furvi TaxID=3028299 RepID=A0AAE4MB71_9EURY|nr:hypothetical protein [Methanocorpusculaceae archaeon Ag1]